LPTLGWLPFSSPISNHFLQPFLTILATGTVVWEMCGIWEIAFLTRSDAFVEQKNLASMPRGLKEVLGSQIFRRL